MEIDGYRQQIDAIDKEIVELLNRRYTAVEQIGKIKTAKGLPIHVPEREKALLEKLCELNKGPMTNEILLNIYQSIIQGSYILEKTEK